MKIFFTKDYFYSQTFTSYFVIVSDDRLGSYMYVPSNMIQKFTFE